MATRKKAAHSEPDPAALEPTLQAIEQIIQRMESEDQPLEQSLADFEAGIRLTRQAQTLLQEAEQKVQQLLEGDHGEPRSAPLDGSHSSSTAELSDSSDT